MGRTKAGLIGLVALVALSGFSCRERVDPGTVGVLIDYCQGSEAKEPKTRLIAMGSYEWVDWICQKMVEYPVSEQTLTMVESPNDNPMPGDDSVLCQAKGGVGIQLDVSVVWQINLAEADRLALKRPGMPLTGEVDKSIAGTLVRPLVRNALNIACGDYTYDEIIADKKAPFQEAAEAIARHSLTESHIVLRQLFVRGAHLTKEQKAAIDEKIKAQQSAQAAFYLLQKREAEALALVAEARGQAEANRILSESLTPEVLEARRIEKWDGKSPQVVGAGTNPMFPIGQSGAR